MSLIQDAKVTEVDGWRTFEFNIQKFELLSTTRGDHFHTPEFQCNGHQWKLRIYPGGQEPASVAPPSPFGAPAPAPSFAFNAQARPAFPPEALDARAFGRGGFAFGGHEVYVAIYLIHVSSRMIVADFEIKILDNLRRVIKSGSNSEVLCETQGLFSFMSGWRQFISRSNLLDPSKNVLREDGTLVIQVSMKEVPKTAFIPKNPITNLIQGMFLDEDKADVCFEIVSCPEGNDDESVEQTVSFPSHRLILQTCAPQLAALFGCGGNETATASVSNVKPEVFRLLLSYVYGCSVSKEDLKTYAKDIIDAADMYSIVNLKLEAEEAYVESTAITTENATDILLYADSKNCALLKERAIDFLADNGKDAISKVSFEDVPGGYLVKDLLVAMTRKSDVAGDDGDEFSIMRVGELRRRLHKKGLDVDGAREAMIA
ncbi:hypothetical protein ACHAWC_000740, partial [Mediolabrus comicus]